MYLHDSTTDFAQSIVLVVTSKTSPNASSQSTKLSRRCKIELFHHYSTFSIMCGTFPPHVRYFHLMWPFSPCMDILTSHGALSHEVEHFHLAWSFPLRVGHLHLTWTFSPCAFPQRENNIFHLAWKSSQNTPCRKFKRF